MPRFVVQEETFLAGMDKEPGHTPRLSDGTERNISKAIKWYTAAATQGYAEAQFDLGEFYMHGYGGVERNRKEGFRWYLKAAQQGHKFAQYETGQCYMMGSGVEKNEAEGLKWLRKAAEQGNHKAMHDLGGLLFQARDRARQSGRGSKMEQDGKRTSR